MTIIAKSMSINELMAALVAELEANEIPDPLAERFTLANVWADLVRLAGEPVPAEVAAVVDGVLDQQIAPLARPMQAGYADYVREALPAD